MKDLDLNKQTKYSLEFILSEGDKHFTEILNSINQNSNRSFLLFGVYLSLITFSFTQIISNNYEYIILFFGATISSLILKNNLFPNKREIKGSSPSVFNNSYFDSFDNEELEKEYIATQIYSYNDSIDINKHLIDKMVKRYMNSIYVVFLFILFFLFFYIYISTQCK